MVDLEEMRLNEIKVERIEECVKKPFLIGDLIDDIELLKKELKKKEYQINCFQRDLKTLSDRLKLIDIIFGTDEPKPKKKRTRDKKGRYTRKKK